MRPPSDGERRLIEALKMAARVRRMTNAELCQTLTEAVWAGYPLGDRAGEAVNEAIRRLEPGECEYTI